MKHSSLLLSDWPSLLSALPSNLDLTALARSKKAIVRCRQVSDGETLLRLALWYGPCGMSLRSASAFSTGTEAAILSDVALFKRLAGAGDWLEGVAAALLSEKPTDDGLERRHRNQDSQAEKEHRRRRLHHLGGKAVGRQVRHRLRFQFGGSADSEQTRTLLAQAPPIGK